YGGVNEITQGGSDDHQNTHTEDPDQQLNLNNRIFHRAENECNESDARNAVRFEPIGRRSNGIAGIVARTVRNDSWISGIVFLDLKSDLHQIRPYVRNLREDAACHAQRGGAQRLADRKSYETFAGEFAREEQQDAEHHEQLDANQQHPDAHACLKRNKVAGIRLAAKAREGGSRVGEGIYPNAEPCHRIASEDTDDAENQNNNHTGQFKMTQKPEIKNHGCPDE